MTEGRIDSFRRTIGQGHAFLARLGLSPPVVVLRGGKLVPETEEDRWIIHTLAQEMREGRVASTDHVPMTIKDPQGNVHGADEIVQHENGHWELRKGDNDG